MTQERLDEIETIRHIGFAIVSHQQTVKAVMSDVETGISHRLEDIYAFADRENPNKHEIMDIVREIQEHLIRVRNRQMAYPV